MKTLKRIPFVILVSLLTAPIALSQVIDDFEDGMLTGWQQFPEGRWAASPSLPINGKYSLHHIFDNTVAAADMISLSTDGLEPELDTVSWRFQIRHGYNPSSTNRWGVFLTGDAGAQEMHPGGNINGFVIGVNYNGVSDDFLRLWEVKSGRASEIINTNVNWEVQVGTGHAAGLRIVRIPGGAWTVYLDASGGFDSLVRVGAAQAGDIGPCRNFGLYFGYTSTKDTLLWFDDLDIEGRFVRDTLPPRVKSIDALSDTSAAIAFTEPVVLTNGAWTDRFTLGSDGSHPDSVLVVTADSMILFFPSVFSDGADFRICVNGLTDQAGNIMVADTASFFYYNVKINDICINEIMADPSPAIDLPEYEYVELYNRTPYDLDLTGWTFTAGETVKTFPACVMRGYSYLMITTSAGAGHFSAFGKVIGLFTSSTTLTNSGTCLMVRNSTTQVIAQVCYSDDWYGDILKKDGGWSLENINPDHPCSGKDQWRASKSPKGGTPGTRNSYYEPSTDIIPPEITGVFPLSDSVLLVKTSEPVGIYSSLAAGSFKVDKGIGVSSGELADPFSFDKIYASFSSMFIPDTLYQLELISSLTDCSGNKAVKGSWPFALPVPADSSWVIFNEIMYQPLAGCPEWIEIHNRSTHTLDLAQLQLALLDEVSRAVQSVSPVSLDGRLLFPGEYAVLTSQPDQLLSCAHSVNPGSIVCMNGMPALSDEGARLQLLTRGLTVVDEMVYQPGMQFPLLTDPHGVSLERISEDRPSLDLTNWHSASWQCGFSTPGLPNSQQFESAETTSNLVTDPEVFSPNNDGNADVVNILCRFDRPGYVATLSIYDAAGRQVRQLANNVLMGTEGAYSWDGRNEGGSLCQPGIYLVLMEAFHPGGGKKSYRKVCVLSGAQGY